MMTFAEDLETALRVAREFEEAYERAEAVVNVTPEQVTRLREGLMTLSAKEQINRGCED